MAFSHKKSPPKRAVVSVCELCYSARMHWTQILALIIVPLISYKFAEKWEAWYWKRQSIRKAEGKSYTPRAPRHRP